MFEGKNLENLAEPLETENGQEKEDAIRGRIDQISLAFSVEKYKQAKAAEADVKLSDFVQPYSTSFAVLTNLLYKRGKEEEVDGRIEAVKKMVDGFGGGEVIDSGAIFDYIKTQVGELDRPEIIGSRENDQKSEKFGMVTYNLEEGKDRKYKNIFEKLGLDESDEVMSVHIGEAYKREGKIDYKDGFSQLALKIKRDFPYVKAVIGRSWLMSSPIADSLGFQKIDVDVPENGFDTWLQFIDKDGQVSKKRFEELLRTGEFPRKNIAGYIMTEDFLKKYLPEDEKGEIFLQEPDLEIKKTIEQVMKEFGMVKTNWDLIMTPEELKKYFASNCPASVLIFRDHEEGRNFFNILLKCKQENKTEADLKSVSEFQEAGIVFNNLLKKIKYKNRKVTI